MPAPMEEVQDLQDQQDGETPVEEAQFTDSIEQEEEVEETPTPDVVTREDIETLTTVSRNAIQQNRLLAAELENLRRQNAPRPAAEPDITDEELAESPVKAMQKLIQRELQASIGPIRADYEAQRRDQQFAQSFKAALPNINPALVEHEAALAPEVRRALGNIDPTPQNIHSALAFALGQMALNGNVFNPSQAPTQQAAMPNTPRVVPPNAPNRAAPPRPNRPKVTESQRRTMKNLGFEDNQEAEFLEFLNADEVSFDTIRGRAK